MVYGGSLPDKPQTSCRALFSPMPHSTSWGKVSGWYDSLMEDKNSFQKKIILPSLLSRMNIQKNETVLDLACGEGFFSREIYKRGANVIGADIAPELIMLAKSKKNTLALSPKRRLDFFTSPAHHLPFLKNESVDAVVIILALQNIANVASVFRECARVSKKQGKIFMVLNHPAFRIPRASSWEWDEKTKTRYRRVVQYLTEFSEKIYTHPGSQTKDYTVTFHRPLQYYFKSLKKNGFVVNNLEEWASNKISTRGPRAQAENEARKEIPLFLYLEAQKI